MIQFIHLLTYRRRIYVSQLTSLASAESESKSSLEELLIESQPFFEDFAQILLIFLTSWHKPELLVML